MPLPLVQLLLYIDTYLYLSTMLYCAAHFSALPTLHTPHSLHVPHPVHFLHPRPLAIPSTKTIHFLFRFAIFVSQAFDPIYIPRAPHNFTLMHGVAAEPRSTAGFLFTSRCPSGTILLTPYSIVWDWRVSREGSMLFYCPKLLYHYYNLLLFFPLSSFCLLVGIVGLGSSD